jgi:integrase
MTLNNARPGARTAESLEWRWAHLEPVFGAVRAANVTTAKVEEYKVQRRNANAAVATINRELATLRRMFRYGKQCTPPTVHQIPYIRMFSEKDNVRKGFIEHDAFERMAVEASKEGLWLRALIEVAYTYGWRRGEMLDLRVRQVDLRARTIRLEPGTTKNDEGREVAMTAKVVALLRAACDGKPPDAYVFTRETGKPVRNFAGAWRNLCVRVGVGHWECTRKCGVAFDSGGRTKCECGGAPLYVGLILHDFRRSAARALRRAGVPESVIMATGGWKTPSMFRRYAIVSSADQRTAMQALEKARKHLSPRIGPRGSKTGSSTGEMKPGSVQ